MIQSFVMEKRFKALCTAKGRCYQSAACPIVSGQGDGSVTGRNQSELHENLNAVRLAIADNATTKAGPEGPVHFNRLPNQASSADVYVGTCTEFVEIKPI